MAKPLVCPEAQYKESVAPETGEVEYNNENLEINPNGTSIYNEEADHDSETIICEVEDEGRPSRIVDGEFSVSLERYFKVTVLDLRVTFEVLCQEATNSLDSYVKRGLLVTQCLNVLAVANEQVKKDDEKDEDPYLSEEIKNESPQYDNSIWVTGRMKINLSDSHCKLVPD